MGGVLLTRSEHDLDAPLPDMPGGHVLESFLDKVDLDGCVFACAFEHCHFACFDGLWATHHVDEEKHRPALDDHDDRDDDHHLETTALLLTRRLFGAFGFGIFVGHAVSLLNTGWSSPVSFEISCRHR